MDFLPPDMDVIAVIDGPGARADVDEADAPSTLQALDDLGLMWETRRSWAGLAEALGYSQEEAASALLSERIVVGWRGLKNNAVLGAIKVADTGWVLVAPVPEQTARRMRDRLNAVPRRISGGHAVYSIDAGRTGMAVVRYDDEWRMVLAPTANAALLDECLTYWKAGLDESTNSDIAGRLAGEIEPGWSALVLANLEEIAGGQVVFSLRGSDDFWTVGFAARVNAKHGAPVGLLGEIGGDALLAAASAGDAWDGSSPLLLGIELEDVASSDRAGIRFDSGYAMVFREGSTESSSMTAIITGRGAGEENFAREADLAFSKMIADSGNVPAHRGLFPDAIRTHTSKGPDGSAWPGNQRRVAWCYSSDADGRSGVFSMSVGSDTTEVSRLARHGREAWSRVVDWNESDAVSVGYARPNKLVEMLDGGIDPVSLVVAQLDYATWDIRQHGDVMRGTVTMRLAPSNARLGSE